MWAGPGLHPLLPLPSEVALVPAVVLEHVAFEGGQESGPLKDVVSVVTLNLLCLLAAFVGSRCAEKEVVMAPPFLCQVLMKARPAQAESRHGLNSFSGGSRG